MSRSAKNPETSRARMTTGIEGEAAMSEPKDIEQLVEFRDQLLEWRNKAIWQWVRKNTKKTFGHERRENRDYILVNDLKDYLGVKP